MRMPEYTPVYVVTGFLDSGKTSLLNQLLSRRLESGHSLCCIQFEQGEQALEQDLIDRGNLDLLHFRFLYKGIIINHNKNRANLH